MKKDNKEKTNKTEKVKVTKNKKETKKTKKRNKINLSKIKKIILKHKKPIILALISLILLIIGSFTVGFIPTILIITILGLLYYFLSKPQKFNKINFIKDIFIFGFTFTIFLIFIGCAFCYYIASNAPKFTAEKLYNKDASILYMANGEEFAKLGEEMRQKITYDEISQSLIDAIVATEDSRFFQHNGVDLPRFLKASFSQVLGKGGGGASTLTMQVSKNAFTSSVDTGIKGILRKFTDIYVSIFEIETHYTKEQIIEFYVNSNNLGNKNRGVEQASQDFFGKSASELNVAEAALVAGIFQAPNGYYPYWHPEECEERRQTVLALMLRHGYINEEEYNIAKELTVDKLLNKQEETENSKLYQDFINTVVEETIKRTGKNPYDTPMKIYTTMDKGLQEHMANIMNGTTFKWENEKVQGASTIIDVKTGKIVAVGGGRNRVVRGENFATSLKRQIGSTAKPLYDYGPAIEFNNWSTYTPLTDEPHSYSDNNPIHNWDHKYFYFETLHEALKHSRNIPALKAFQSNKNSDIKKFVTNLGLSPEQDLHEAHALGGYNGESPMSLAAAYAAISNGGYYHEPHSFTKIIFTETNETYDVKPVTRRAMSESTAYMLTKILEDTAPYAIGRNVNNVNYAGKTGTTNLANETKQQWGLPSYAINDKWIASFNDTYSIAVWYGYEHLSKDFYLTEGNRNIKTLFQAIAKGAYTKRSNWTQPNSVVKMQVEYGLPTAMLPSEFTPEDLKFTAYFKRGFEPTETSKRFSKLNDVTNLKYDEKEKLLTWDKIDTPQFSDENYLNKIYSELYQDEGTKQQEINKHLDYNRNNIGNVVYNIYTKEKDGTLKLITTTSNNSFKIPVLKNTTFVVKTSYSIFKPNISNGVELKVEPKIPALIQANLTTKSTIVVGIDEGYEEPKKPVIVTENVINDVTSEATITVSILRNSDNKVLKNIDEIKTDIEDMYTITYHVSYGDFKDDIIKIVQIEKKVG